MNADGLKTIRGDVLPLAGNKNCRAVMVVDEVEYHVVPRGAGTDLVDHFSEQVEAEGMLSEDEDGIHWIQVRSFRLVDNLDEDALYED